MEKINLFLIDMSEDGTITGVTRYLETLIRGLSSHSDIDVCWIRLIHSRKRLIHHLERVDSHWEYIIPLPLAMDPIINQSFWNQKYIMVVFHIIKHLFEGKKNILLHTHTLNLIDLSLYIKSKVDCKIITHLHCIPWKGIYNRNQKYFNHLYEMAYVHPTPETDRKLILSSWEYRSYTKADRLICVTRCGADFVRKGVTDSLSPIDVIPNGMDDFCKKRTTGHKVGKLIRLVYAGTLSPSKGLPSILEALRGVRHRGYDVQLQVAGSGHPRFVNLLMAQYSDLNIKFLGLLPFDELKDVYRISDIGVIASLQEQASYVALEMAMFGLAVITTAVDGLDEMFTDEVTALKVGVSFSKEEGLKANVKMLEDKIIELIEDKRKRQRLSYNARQMYLRELTLERMIERTVAIYHQFI